MRETKFAKGEMNDVCKVVLGLSVAHWIVTVTMRSVHFLAILFSNGDDAQDLPLCSYKTS